jgi:hypothetical protein
MKVYDLETNKATRVRVTDLIKTLTTVPDKQLFVICDEM